MTLAAIGAGGMGALWLWWQDQPRDLYTLGGWLTGAGRITGLLAGYGIAVQLLLMSRAPALDRGIGTDRLARWHAFSGGYTVSLMLVHTVLITWGYAVSASEGLIPQASSLLTGYPDVLMATGSHGQPCTSRGVIWPRCALSLASSFAGGSSPATAGGNHTRSRCRPRRAQRSSGCGSP